MNQEVILVEHFKSLGIELSEDQKKQFLSYYTLLVEWNEHINLTAITEFNEVVLKHFVDSILIDQVFNIKEIESVIDIGTGAGFPGIPLKIIFPHLNVLLLDSLNKRVKFLKEVILQLGLKGITAIHSRAEDLAVDKEHREQYDLAVSRAVANLATLSEYCLPFVKIGGKFIAYKSGEIKEEVNGSNRAIEALGGKLFDIPQQNLPGTDIKRSFVNIDKIKETPKRFPRKAGKPSKEPIM